MADGGGAGGGNQRPAKKLRTDAVYPRGTVKCVRVKNFMTYGDMVEIVPGPRLNLVLGPNGTGKSSLVCALCVGLAGSAKLLGRADSVKEYIKRGCDEGWVETTLSGGPGTPDIVVRRDMKKAGDTYTSTWRINNHSKLEKDVKKLVADLNIQFDNLCQFLPQDKVVEFARMDPYELLLATEKAIGDASMYEQHQALIKKREEAKQQGLGHAALVKQLEAARASKEKLERDYERYRRRIELQQDIEVLHAREQWVRVDEARAEFDEAKSMLELATRQWKQAKEEVAREEGPLKKVKQDLDAAQARYAALTREGKIAEGEVSKLVEKETKDEEKIQKLQMQLERLRTDSELRLQTIQGLRKNLAAKEAEVASLPPVPNNSGRMTELGKQASELQSQASSMAYEQRQLGEEKNRLEVEISRQQNRINQLHSERYSRLKSMAKVKPGLESAHQWTEEQKRAGAFKGQVFGPLGVEINLQDPSYAAYLEQGCGDYLYAWVVSDKEDEALLGQHFKANGFYGVRVVTTNINQKTAGLNLSQERLAQLGVAATLDDMYDAPMLIKATLRNTAYLAMGVFMPHPTDQATDAALDTGATVYTPQQTLRRIRSTYGGKADGMDESREIRRPSVLGGGANAADIQQQQAAAEGRIEELRQQIAQVDANWQTVEGNKEEVDRQADAVQTELNKLRQQQTAALRKHKDANEKLKAIKERLSKYEQQPDPLDREPLLQRQMAKEQAAHLATLAALVAAARQHWERFREGVAVELRFKELEMQSAALKAAGQALRAKEQQAAVLVRQATQVAQGKKAAWEGAKSQAQKEWPLSPELQAAFQQLPSDRDEIQGRIAELEVEVKSIVCNNPRVQQEYEEKVQQVRQLQEEWENAGVALEAVNAAIEQLKDEWLPALNEVVAKINSSFSTNFAHIGCAGEVVLVQHEDFDKYAIQVCVKFREGEELQMLTAHRQSGGERSVSTILYLIALQGVTVTPFRVVDEINQGMDPINERKVFKHLVEASTAPGTPQCFLLTPKLLPDLPFTRDVTVLQIFNGPLVAEGVARRFTSQTLYGARLAQHRQQPLEVA